LTRNGIFNRCTGFIFTTRKIAAAVTTEFLLPRFTANAPAACSTGNGLEPIRNIPLAARSGDRYSVHVNAFL
jgi:hypothetical protein